MRWFLNCTCFRYNVVWKNKRTDCNFQLFLWESKGCLRRCLCYICLSYMKLLGGLLADKVLYLHSWWFWLNVCHQQMSYHWSSVCIVAVVFSWETVPSKSSCELFFDHNVDIIHFCEVIIVVVLDVQLQIVLL